MPGTNKMVPLYSTGLGCDRREALAEDGRKRAKRQNPQRV
jgi:hypothetical protein